MLTPTDLANYVRTHHIQARLITHIGDTSTVPAAAAALNVPTDAILKTLLFFVQTRPYLVISHGVTPVPVRVLADYFGVGKRQVKLAKPAQVLAETGYPVGGVPPLGHHKTLPVMMAKSLLDFDVVFGGGGDSTTMLEIPVTELLRIHEPTLLALRS